MSKEQEQTKASEDFDSVFNTSAPEDVAKQRQAAMEAAGNWMPYLNVPEEGSAVVRFMDNRPLTFYQHRVWDKSLREGQGAWRTLTCIRENCPLCMADDKPRYVGAYRVVHIDHIEKDQSGKEVQRPTLKIFLKGINTLEILERKNKKKKLNSENMDVERIGSGFDTKYIFEFNGDAEVPKDYKKPDEVDLKKIFAPQTDVMKRLAAEKKGATPASPEKKEKPADPETGNGGDDYEDDLPF